MLEGLARGGWVIANASVRASGGESLAERSEERRKAMGGMVPVSLIRGCRTRASNTDAKQDRG